MKYWRLKIYQHGKRCSPKYLESYVSKITQIAYYSYGEIVVDDAVWDRISIFLFVIGYDINLPSIQHYLSTVLNIFKYFY